MNEDLRKYLPQEEIERRYQYLKRNMPEGIPDDKLRQIAQSRVPLTFDNLNQIQRNIRLKMYQKLHNPEEALQALADSAPARQKELDSTYHEAQAKAAEHTAFLDGLRALLGIGSKKPKSSHTHEDLPSFLKSRVLSDKPSSSGASSQQSGDIFNRKGLGAPNKRSDSLPASQPTIPPVDNRNPGSLFTKGLRKK